MTQEKKPLPTKLTKIRRKLLQRIHILEWLPRYTKGDVIADIVAGITVGLTMIPQSIAYAGLAGLAAQYGLYTAFIGSFTYVFFGTIKEVSIGPTSLMALLTAPYATKLSIDYVILLTFIAGCMELLMGVLRLGFLVDFISPCLTSGFTSASAVIIIVAQTGGLLGLSLHSHKTFESIILIGRHISETRWGDTFLGLSCIIFLVAFKQLTRIPTNNPKVRKVLWFLSISKNALCVLICASIGYYLHEFKGGAPFKLTGPVPKGLPHFGLPSFSTFNATTNQTTGFVDMVKSLGSGCIVIPAVAVLANVAIAKSYSSNVVDATQEMMTLGFCNILGSCVQAMPSCGAFTRSSVASSSGVRTPIQGIYSGTIIILALSFLAPYFYYIPKATLAAVLITAASSLIDYEIYPVLWRCNKIDFIITLMTFIIGIVFTVQWSIIIGVTVNALVLLRMWTRPKITSEIRSSGPNRNYIYIKPELGLFYPACNHLIQSVKKEHLLFKDLPIAIDCSNILEMDYSGAKAIEGLMKTYNRNEINLVLLNVQPNIYDSLNRIVDTSNLHFCQSKEDICERTFGNTAVESKFMDCAIPLLENNLKSAADRKMSLYDNV